MRIIKEAKFSGFEWFRKPTVGDLRAIKNDYKINQRQFNEIDRGDFDKKYFKDFKSFLTTNLDSFPQYFVAELEKEEVLLFVNTEGFNYPRYVVYIPDELTL